jgi:hypothetical protein
MSEVATQVPARCRDFDFLHGDWNVLHRRLTIRHVNSGDWEEFHGTATSHGFFDGAGGFDELSCPAMGFSGATFRTFDRKTRQWSIYWVSSRCGRLDPPVVGEFRDGIGTFYGDDADGDTPVRVRFIWSDITASSARWEQAFSVDGELTWEINWVMRYTRRT